MEVQIGNNEKEIPIEIDNGFTKSSKIFSARKSEVALCPCLSV